RDGDRADRRLARRRARAGRLSRRRCREARRPPRRRPPRRRRSPQERLLRRPRPRDPALASSLRILTATPAESRPVVAVLASIPSPHKGVVDVGPLHLHAYGITLLVAIAACIWLTGIRWRRLGGDWDFILRVAVWGVAFGIVGARAYHDATSWNEVPKHWWGPFAVWEGGLGVWGGIALGTLVGAIVARRSGQSARLLMDAAAPGRPGPPLRGAAAERLGLDRRLLLLDGVLRVVAVLPPRRRRA